MLCINVLMSNFCMYTYTMEPSSRMIGSFRGRICNHCGCKRCWPRIIQRRPITVLELADMNRPHATCNITLVEEDAKLHIQDSDFLTTWHVYNTEVWSKFCMWCILWHAYLSFTDLHVHYLYLISKIQAITYDLAWSSIMMTSVSVSLMLLQRLRNALFAELAKLGNIHAQLGINVPICHDDSVWMAVLYRWSL